LLVSKARFFKVKLWGETLLYELHSVAQQGGWGFRTALSWGRNFVD